MTDNSRDLIQRVARGIQASQTTSATPPGQTNSKATPPPEGHIEAINQVFALFRLNYHNQYYAAFPDAEQLKQIKKLWLESLRDYSVDQILRGARHALENSEYLPTLHRMHKCCQEGLVELGLPSLNEAYLEACQAPSPKSAQRWSHPAVYLAGRDSGWYFLSNHQERQTRPVFEQHYRAYCQRVMRGEELSIPEDRTLEKHQPAPLPREEQLAQLKKLREQTGL